MVGTPFLVFPLRRRKYVRLTQKQAYESMFHLMSENLDAENIESSQEKASFVKAKLGGTIGVKVNVQLLSEGNMTTLEFSFSYRNLLFISIIFLITMIGLSLILYTPIPMVGTVLILPLAYKANSVAMRFLNTVNEAMPYLEREYAHKALREDRKRWQLEPKDTEDLYRRLREKHIKTWGNTNVLEYKIAEYERQGLTHNEAIRKTAEEEGIY